MKPTKEGYLKAAELIERNGKIEGAYASIKKEVDDSCQFCAWGAVVYAHDPNLPRQQHGFRWTENREAIIEPLQKHVNSTHGFNARWFSITLWSDFSSKSEVVSALRAVAEKLGRRVDASRGLR